MPEATAKRRKKKCDPVISGEILSHEKAAATSSSMANLRRKSRTLSKDEDVLDPGRWLPNEPPAPAPPEAPHPPSQVPARSRRGSVYEIAEQKTAATPSPVASLRCKSSARPPGEDAFELAKPPSTTPASAEARQPTGQVPGRSRRGSGNYADEKNAATPAPPVANIRSKGLAVSKGEVILDIEKPLATKPVSSAPRDVPQQQEQIPPKSRRGSWYEPLAKAPERQANLKGRSDTLGQKGAAVGGPQKIKGSQPSYKHESQVYITAPEPSYKGPQQSAPPEKGDAQLPPYQRESELDDRQTNVSWPCMLCTMTVLVTLVFVLILFMVESTEKLVSLEKTTTSSSTLVAHATTLALRRKMVESTTLLEPDVPASAEYATTTEVELSVEEEDDDARMTFTTTVHGDVDEEALTPLGRNNLTH
ncbi:hypothetical protein HPB49_013146 [Dermacentor silvarum]|uniref:Uncharacterized protein n=1 Tax=Dermacentor silvarum TaxID=543639 RepID=A0ACB8DZZ3_DERSI|nr:hypothetical protein HPB49_013146 [Dermacentor silvarum]